MQLQTSIILSLFFHFFLQLCLFYLTLFLPICLSVYITSGSFFSYSSTQLQSTIILSFSCIFLSSFPNYITLSLSFCLSVCVFLFISKSLCLLLSIFGNRIVISEHKIIPITPSRQVFSFYILFFFFQFSYILGIIRLI